MRRVEHWNHNTHYYPLVLAAAPDPCARALDVGCGDGLLVRALASRCAAVTGLDRSAEMVDQARMLCAGLPNTDFVAADLLAADLPDGGFDLVASVAAIHHLDFAAGLRRMATLLRPGGVLVVVGLANNGSLADRVISLAGVPTHQVLRLRHGYWAHGSPLADPDLTWGQVRTAARRLLPGVRWRRHLLWRYSLTWTKPA